MILIIYLPPSLFNVLYGIYYNKLKYIFLKGKPLFEAKFLNCQFLGSDKPRGIAKTR